MPEQYTGRPDAAPGLPAACLLSLTQDDPLQDEHLTRRLEASGFQRIRPAKIRLVDNTRAFGFKEELVLAPGEP